MTQKEATILVEIITKVVRKELNSFKKQLLTEGYNVSGKRISETINRKPLSAESSFRSNVKVNRPVKENVSRDPLLNSILMETISIEEAEANAMQFEEELMERGINLPTGERGGIMSTNKNVDHVLQAMNRDYSGMFAPKQTVQQKPTQVSNEKSQLRSNYLAMMQEDYIPETYPIKGGQIPAAMSGFPSVQPFSGDEEDLTWLNEVQ